MMVGLTAILFLALFAGGYGQEKEVSGGDSYIFNGTPAKPGSLPYVVAILTRWYTEKESKNKITCSGTLIARNKVLAAAHCFDQLSEWQWFFAGLGYADLDTGSKQPGAKLVKITSAERPQEYNSNVELTRDIRGDIAVATLEEEVTLSDTIKLATLGGKTKAELIGQTGFVAGWGYYSEGKLMVANGQTVAPDDTDNCKRMFRHNPIPASVMCVTNKGQESCKGDSGASLIIDGKVEGVVSWGAQCELGLPGFYTNLGSFLAWVKERL